MALKLPALQSKVNQASKSLAKNGHSYYKMLLEKNKHYIQEPPTIERCQLLENQLFYARLARFLLFNKKARNVPEIYCTCLVNGDRIDYSVGISSKGTYYARPNIPNERPLYPWKP